MKNKLEKRPFILKEVFRSIHYEIKYLAEKSRAKNQFYADNTIKAELKEQLDEKDKTILHQKEIIKNLRKESKEVE